MTKLEVNEQKALAYLNEIVGAPAWETNGVYRLKGRDEAMRARR